MTAILWVKTVLYKQNSVFVKIRINVAKRNDILSKSWMKMFGAIK